MLPSNVLKLRLDLRNAIALKLDVDNRADDLNDTTATHCCLLNSNLIMLNGSGTANDLGNFLSNRGLTQLVVNEL